MTNAESESLREQYRQLCSDYELYAREHPHVENTQKLQRRVARDLSALNRFVEEGVRGDDDPIWLETRRNQLQGFKNNFVNHDEKLRVARSLEGVVSLGKVFQYPLAPGIEEKNKSVEERDPKPVKVEVDVVANQGNAWVQIRTVKIADIDSLHWIGMPGHHKGLEMKLMDLMVVSQSMEHWIRWRAPDVVVYCPEHFGEDVVEEIRSMGAHAISGDLENLKQIPPPPPAPAVTNLDVTAICALVSEVSYGGPQNPDVVQWAHSNKHWRICIEQEERDPLLPHLEPYLSNRPLIAAEAAVLQFESLLQTLSGPREMQRWQELKSKLSIYRTAENMQWLSERVTSVEDVTDLQSSVFGLGDTAKALTITCNQKLVQKLKQHGIHLECLVHRPVWLTGL